MNMLAIKVGLRTFGAKTVFFVQKHMPQILVGTGVAGFVGTAVASGKAAVKARDILDHKDAMIEAYEGEALNPDIPMSKQDCEKAIKEVKRGTRMALIKTFAPPVTLGAASAALIFGGNHMLGRRAAAALASAYEAQTKLHKYRGNVVDQLGAEVDQKLSNGMPLDKLDISEKLKERGQEERKNAEEGVKVLNKDPYNHQNEFWFSSITCGKAHGSGMHKEDRQTNLAYLIHSERNLAPDRLMWKGYLLINDLLDDFGADPTSYGATHGWYIDPQTGEIPTISYGIEETEYEKEWKKSAMDIERARFYADKMYDDDPDIKLVFNCNVEPITDMIDKINSKRNYKRYAHITHKHYN